MNCKNCGACCKKLKDIMVFSNEIPKNHLNLFKVNYQTSQVIFLSTKDDSGCPLYKEGEGCILGENRPISCRIFPILISPKGLSLKKLFFVYDLIKLSFLHRNISSNNPSLNIDELSSYRFGEFLLQENFLELIACERFYTIKKRDFNKTIHSIIDFLKLCISENIEISVDYSVSHYIIIFAINDNNIRYSVDMDSYFKIKKKERNFVGFLVELLKYINNESILDKDFVGDYFEFLGLERFSWDTFYVNNYCINNESVIDNMYITIKNCNEQNKSFRLIKDSLNKLDYVLSKKENTLKISNNAEIDNNSDNDINENEDTFSIDNNEDLDELVSDIINNPDISDDSNTNEIKEDLLDNSINQNEERSPNKELLNEFERNGCGVREHERRLKNGYKTIVKEHERKGTIVNKMQNSSNLINIGITDSQNITSSSISKTLEESIISDMEEQNTKLKKLRAIVRKNHPELPKIIPNSILELSDDQIEIQQKDCALANTKKIDNLLNDIEISPEIEFIRHKINVDAKTRNLNRTEPANKTFVINKPKRDKKLADFVKKEANGICECCDNLSFITIYGEYALQAYRLNNLASDGKDEYYNIIAVCPMCEAKLIYSNDKEKWKEYAQKKILMKRYGKNPPKLEDLGL